MLKGTEKLDSAMLSLTFRRRVVQYIINRANNMRNTSLDAGQVVQAASLIYSNASGLRLFLGFLHK